MSGIVLLKYMDRMYLEAAFSEFAVVGLGKFEAHWLLRNSANWNFPRGLKSVPLADKLSSSILFTKTNVGTRTPSKAETASR